MYRAYDHDWGWQQRKSAQHDTGLKPQTVVASAHTTDCTQLEDWRVLVHPLVWCPPLAKGTHYLLVQRTWPGQRHVLAAGRARFPHESLNLARVRHTATTIGANEVHILPG